MFKSALKYGTIGGLIILVYVTILTRTGLTFQEGIGPILGYLAIVIMPICTFLAIKEYQLKYARGKLLIRDALIVGLLLSMFAACIYSGLRWVEYVLFTDSYADYLAEARRAELEASGENADLIEEKVQNIRAYYKSWKPFQNTLRWYLGLGIIYSLGSFFWLRYFNKPK